MSITVRDLTEVMDGRPLFEKVTMSFNPKCRYGLTGPNGSGKSTFLKILCRQYRPTSGEVSVPQKLGVLQQDIAPFSSFRVLDVVLMGNKRLWKALCEKETLFDQEFTEAVGIRLGELEETIAQEDGYLAETEAETLLAGCGVPEALYTKMMKEIPTDMQFRVLLVQALFGHPSALLLDEPTNHLDLASIRWLEEVLRQYAGTLIVVSHDRHFLNAVATHIADIDYETVILYPGTYDDMIVAKTTARQSQEADMKSKEKKIAQLKEFVAKFSAGTRASQVQSRLKEIDKLQPGELKKTNIQRPYIRFTYSAKKPGDVTCSIKGISQTYERPIIKNFNFDVMRGDKIGVIGNNGEGKTTLLKIIAHQLTPDHGTVQYGHEVMMHYFPQNHQDVLTIQDQELSLFDYLRSKKQGVYDQDIRSVLGKMLFSGEDAFKKIKHLSGGERVRLILSAMMLEESNFLILDEPNNHLDLEAVSALAVGLEQYPGTVIVASHDRDLVTKVANKLFVFEQHQLRIFDGTLETYFSLNNPLRSK